MLLRIFFDKNEVLKTLNLQENIENMPNTANITYMQFSQVYAGFFEYQESSLIDDFVNPNPVITSEKNTIIESIDSTESNERAIIQINQLITKATCFEIINGQNTVCLTVSYESWFIR